MYNSVFILDICASNVSNYMNEKARPGTQAGRVLKYLWLLGTLGALLNIKG